MWGSKLFLTSHHSTELFKIFLSLLTLQLLFCKKLVGREKSLNCCHGNTGGEIRAFYGTIELDTEKPQFTEKEISAVILIIRSLELLLIIVVPAQVDGGAAEKGYRAVI